MSHPSEHIQRLLIESSRTSLLAMLIVVAGCARGTSDKTAAPPEHRAESRPATASDQMVGDAHPAPVASQVERVTPVQPDAADDNVPIARSAAPPPRTAAAPRHRQPKSLAYEEFPAMAAADQLPPAEGPSFDSAVSAERNTAISSVVSAERNTTISSAVSAERKTTMPAGAQRHSEQGFATVQVFYATDRQRDVVPLSAYQFTGQRSALAALAGCSLLLILLAALNFFRGRRRSASITAMAAGVSACMAAGWVAAGHASIEKHGVTYTGDRGEFTRGVCQVTVPDSHRRGLVERPSLLRFEVRENQQQHIVLTSAIELAATDFHRRLSETLSSSPDRDLLVFIHGYNVDFQSAVRRTAQIAVDLPFEGVPVCYSWPSQGSLLGYSVDANNALWTCPHLKQFLQELAQESGAQSINVIAHSMGNRAMTAAMQQISWERDRRSDTPFDRIVLAAPDVDADRFRRDFAPSLLDVSNQVTLYASSDDQALVASKQVHGYPRAGESGPNIVVVPGIETIDVSGIDLSLLGHSYYGDNESMLRDLYEVVRARLPAPKRGLLIPKSVGPLTYWQLAQRQNAPGQGARR